MQKASNLPNAKHTYKIQYTNKKNTLQVLNIEVNIINEKGISVFLLFGSPKLF